MITQIQLIFREKTQLVFILVNTHAQLLGRFTDTAHGCYRAQVQYILYYMLQKTIYLHKSAVLVMLLEYNIGIIGNYFLYSSNISHLINFKEQLKHDNEFTGLNACLRKASMSDILLCFLSTICPEYL